MPIRHRPGAKTLRGQSNSNLTVGTTRAISRAAYSQSWSHGDAAGAEAVQDALTAWLTDMGLIGAGHLSQVGRYVGYMEPYATSHDALDRDASFQEETQRGARPD